MGNRVRRVNMGVLLVAALGAAGCSSDWADRWSTTSRINRAFPLPTDLRVQHADLMEAVRDDAEVKRRVTEQYQRFMKVRALDCTQSVDVGWFDSVSAIQDKVRNLDCFKQRDASLLQWVGLQSLAVELRKPPLRPVAALPANGQIIAAPNTTSLLVSTSSNVGVAKNGSGLLTVVDLSGGPTLSQFQGPSDWSIGGSVSPNGRMLATPVSNSSLQIFRLDKGESMFKTSQYNGLIEWLPKQEAVLLKDRQGVAHLMDLKSGDVRNALAGLVNVDWSLPMPGVDGRYVMGSSDTVALVDIGRDAKGALTIDTPQRWKLESRKGSGWPALFLKGKRLVYSAHPDLAWVNTDDGTQGKWLTSALNTAEFTKMSDTTLSLWHGERGAVVPPKRKLLDLTTMTLAEITPQPDRGDYSFNIPPRSGLASATGSAINYLTQVATANPEPFDDAVERGKRANDAFQLQLQIARMEAMRQSQADPLYEARQAQVAAAAAEAAAAAAREAAGSSSRPPSASSRTSIVSPEMLEAYSKQVRAANAAAAIRDGLPRDVIDDIRHGRSRSNQATTTVVLPGKPAPEPMLKGVPSQARLHMIGVYEGVAEKGREAIRTARPVVVSVMPGNTPLVLSLSSYEAVRWRIVNPSNRPIAAVLLSGYTPSTVEGSAPVTRIGSKYAYKLDSREYVTLKDDIAHYVANPVSSFQGAYSGQRFDIN